MDCYKSYVVVLAWRLLGVIMATKLFRNKKWRSNQRCRHNYIWRPRGWSSSAAELAGASTAKEI
jgi:hypothetical protein